MFRRFIVVLMIFLVLSVIIPGIAEAKNNRINFMVGNPGYEFLTPEGKNVIQRMDVAPFIENGRTYIPVRYLAYAMGVNEKDVIWDEATQTVTLSMEGTTVKLQVGNKVIYVNGQPREMDVVPLIRNERVFLPARFVAEAFGYNVGWRPYVQMVIISY